MLRPLLVLVAVLVAAAPALAQDNYEIQVYGADTVEKGATMFETHTNFTPRGHSFEDGMRPTQHAVHETFEITHGWNDWFETGFYIFTYAHSGYGWQWVGDHVRPRVRVPDKWHWPVGVSLSTEFGYQRPLFSADTWTFELRPIVDKKLGRWYFAFNPSLERALVGANSGKGFEFSPNAKFSYDLTKKVSAGLEYYGALGPISNFDSLAEQEQQIFPSIDLNLSPNWEFNAGAGIGTTRSTDRLILKVIVGYRFLKKAK
ncbi:MAG: hypothetical protein ACR2IF_06410 [Terriglobales bacterium]